MYNPCTTYDERSFSPRSLLTRIETMTRENPQTSPPPALYIEQHLLGELADRHRPAVEAWLSTAEGAAQLEALRVSNASTLDAHPSARVAAAIEQRARLDALDRRDAQRWRPAALALAAVALIGLVITGLLWERAVPSTPVEPAAPVGQGPSELVAKVILKPGEVDDQTQNKGLTPALHIHRQGEQGEPHPLASGDTAHTHDRLQLSYVSAARRYGVVLSIDGRGAVTVHFPDPIDQPARLSPKGEVSLPHSYQLDDAPRFERFFFITSLDDPIDLPAVMAAARELAESGDAQTGDLALDGGLEQRAMTLKKIP